MTSNEMFCHVAYDIHILCSVIGWRSLNSNVWRHYISSTIGFKSYFDIGKTSVFLIKKVFKLTNYKSTHLRYSKNVTTAETTWRTKISCNRKHKLMTHRNLDCTLRIWNYIQRKFINLFESKKSIIISLFTFIW